MSSDKTLKAHISHVGLQALLLIGVIFLLPSAGFPEEKNKEKFFDTFSLYWENDIFSGTDGNYTNGILLNWSTPYLADGQNGRHLPTWSYPVINRLPYLNNPNAQRAVSISLGQLMFTPEDIQTSELIPDDRPYAGYLYGGIGFNSILDDRQHTWQFNVGVVGPASQAQDIQDFVHGLFGIQKAQGWDNQLKNEPTFEAIYETKWRVSYSQWADGFGYDFIPHLGARLGNVAIYANSGAEFRVGWFIPEDFGSCGIRPGCETNPASSHNRTGDFRSIRTSIHFFSILDGRLVLRDIFLDGNTFKDSHSVEKNYFVADLMVGIALYYKRFKVSYAYTFRTEEFETQNSPHTFGSVSISFTY